MPAGLCSVERTPPERSTYFHGTSPAAAVAIAVDGFRLLELDLRNYGNGAIGAGIYLAGEPRAAVEYARDGHVVLGCDLAAGHRVLRLDGSYDHRVIRSLRKEFGHDLLRADFDRAIPANKHLERRELIHLLNYLWTRNEYGGILGLFADDLTRTARRTLQRHRYSGFGDPEGIGVVIVNPSAVCLRNVFVYDEAGSTLATIHPRDLARLAARRLIAEHACAIRRSTSTTLTGRTFQPDPRRPPAEIDAQARATETVEAATHRLQLCLRQFCACHHIVVDADIANALDSL